jgi:transcriptional regulator with XRE-family HTH domain
VTGTSSPSQTSKSGRSVEGVSIQQDVQEFLTTRRARITPEQAGLPSFGSKRRVTGLRREEVAMLAGVSADYYVRLERGNLRGVSEQVLDALARALQLDEVEREHLADLARASTGPVRGSRRATVSKVRPGVLRLLESLTTPAYVRNDHGDILAANASGFALYDRIFDRDTLPLNLAKFLFLDGRAAVFYRDWDKVADDMVAALRQEAGRNPHDKGLSDLIGELATRSQEFSARWARHNVKHHRSANKRIHHHMLGDLDVTGEALQLPGDDLVIITYTAEPDSPAAEALRFLASWAPQQVSEPS